MIIFFTFDLLLVDKKQLFFLSRSANQTILFYETTMFYSSFILNVKIPVITVILSPLVVENKKSCYSHS